MTPDQTWISSALGCSLRSQKTQRTCTIEGRQSVPLLGRLFTKPFGKEIIFCIAQVFEISERQWSFLGWLTGRRDVFQIHAVGKRQFAPQGSPGMPGPAVNSDYDGRLTRGLRQLKSAGACSISRHLFSASPLTLSSHVREAFFSPLYWWPTSLLRMILLSFSRWDVSCVA